MEFLPGDREVLHHVIAYLTSQLIKLRKLVPLAQGRISQGLILEDSLITLVKIAVGWIPRGSNLLLQMHYTTSGREAVDATKVGIFLHKKPPAYVMSGDVVGPEIYDSARGERA